MNILKLVLILVIVPYLCGIGLRKERDGVPIIWGKGYIVMLAASFFPAFICGFFKGTLRMSLLIWALILAAWIVFSLIRTRGRGFTDPFRESFKKKKLVLAEIIMIVVVGIQAFIPVFMMHEDLDDSSYIALSSTAVETDTLVEHNPQTGYPVGDRNPLRMKYIVTTLYAFHAMISLFTGIKPVILIHTYMPFFLTVLSYLLYYALGNTLFEEDRNKAAVFTVIASVVQMSSYISVYLSGTFSLIRIWQGKGQFCAVIIPALLFVFISMMNSERIERADYAFLGAALICAAVMTPIGNLLALSMAAVLAVITAVKRRKISVIPYTALSMIVPVFAMGFYGIFLLGV